MSLQLKESSAQVRGSHKRFLPVRYYWLRLRWCCTRCSNRRLDTRDTAGSPTGTGIRTGSPSAVSSWSLQWKEFLKGSGFLIHNPITNQCVYGDQRAKSYFLHVRKHKMVLSDSIRSASCRCTWWICRSWRTNERTKGSNPVKTTRSRVADGERSHLWVKLLLGARVTILAAVSAVTLGRFAPLVAVFHTRTRCRPAATVAMTQMNEA